jgi:YD repeat-containing protein
MTNALTRRLGRIEKAIGSPEPLVIEVHYVARSIDPQGASVKRRSRGGYRFTYHPDGRRTEEVIPEEAEESL